MICISRRSCRKRFLSSESTSWPANVICPAVGSIKRNRQRPTVDLPQPDSPTSPNVSPAKMSNDTPSTARTTSSEPSTGKCFTRPRTLTSVSRISGGRSSCWFVSTETVMNFLVIGGHGSREIIEHTTHLHSAFELIKRNRTFSATWHSMRTTRREVTAGRQVHRTRHDTFNRFQTLLFDRV